MTPRAAARGRLVMEGQRGINAHGMFISSEIYVYFAACTAHTLVEFLYVTYLDSQQNEDLYTVKRRWSRIARHVT